MFKVISGYFEDTNSSDKLKRYIKSFLLTICLCRLLKLNHKLCEHDCVFHMRIILMLNFKKYFPVVYADKLIKHGIHLSFLSQSEMEKF